MLSDIPVLGPILFSGSPYLYFTLIIMVVFTYFLFRTRWGLRLRASGEKPSAAGTVGIDVISDPLPRDAHGRVLLAGIAGSSLRSSVAGHLPDGDDAPAMASSPSPR